MTMQRRTFLTTSSASLLGFLGLDLHAPAAGAEIAIPQRGTMTSTICPFCAVGCGAIATVVGGQVVGVEGDPDHPINRGTLCAKGSALSQVADNPRRVTRVLYRAPGGSEWEEKDWTWAIRRIATKIQHTRDATFQITDAQGRTVNRTEAIGCLGGAALNNEECYLFGKLSRALGIVYLEHQARVCHSSTVTGLGATFGRGAMTNHWIDMANADAVMMIGANVAENHPVAMHWVMEARRRGAPLIAVDPRFTRTAAVSDLYVPLRSGTDIALVGGLIHHALEHDLVQKPYLVAHTNASYLVDSRFTFQAGRFGPVEPAQTAAEGPSWGYQHDAEGRIEKDPSLEDPRCVFQLLKQHYARYTPDTVSAVCGTPRDTLAKLAESFCHTHRPDRAGTILYSMGATQHSCGTQNVRSYAVLQLLLGNIGMAGGGVNALRGESNVQGSTDHGLLFDYLPGYLKTPHAGHDTLDAHLKSNTPPCSEPQSANWWRHYPKYFVSLLKAYWGAHAVENNQFAYHYLPKIDGDYSHLAMFDAMHEGRIDGLIVLGQNPAVSGPDLHRERTALDHLDWLVVADLWETETAAFWKRPGAESENIATEVFLLPVAASLEKEGSLTNSGRWAQWRRPAVAPSGEAKGDLWILDRLCRQLKELYGAGGTLPEPVVGLNWDYGEDPDPHAVAREINGRFLRGVRLPDGKRFAPGEQVPSFALLTDDGTTAAGNWLYCGSYVDSENKMARRQAATRDADPLGLHPHWSWSWPANRRILYNRASCDASGKPWDPRRPVVVYDRRLQRWTGDVPDGSWAPVEKADGSLDPDGREAFLMLPDGRACLFAPTLADGPFPEHYEPLESPVRNALSAQQCNPLAKVSHPEQLGDASRFPIVATTCRVSEHWLSGAISRNLPWLVELVPNAFVEISKQLAGSQGVVNGDLVTVSSARGQITLHAVVTGRLRPLAVQGRQVEQIALVWHFGYQGLATGPSANLLTPHVGDANTMIPEYKAFLCDVRKTEPEEP